MRASRAVAFDFNGTLSDDEPILYTVYRDMFARAGRPLSPGDYYEALAGVSSAKAAGLYCVAVLGTHPPERLRDADELVEAIDVGLVRRLLG